MTEIWRILSLTGFGNLPVAIFLEYQIKDYLYSTASQKSAEGAFYCNTSDSYSMYFLHLCHLSCLIKAILIQVTLDKHSNTTARWDKNIWTY